MEKQKLSYVLGLVGFIFCVVFVASLYTTPDGRPILYLFFFANDNIPSRILPAWSYIFLACATISLIFTTVFWRKCIENYKELTAIRFALPALVLLLVAVIGVSNLTYPVFTPIIDRVYFSSISRRSGIEAVTFTWHDYSFRMIGGPTVGGTRQEFVYDFTFMNHGSSTVEFQVKPMEVDLQFGEVFARQSIFCDETMELVVFVVDSGQYVRFSDEMVFVSTTVMETYLDELVTNGYDNIFLELTCVNTGTRHEILPLTRPLFGS